MAFAYPVCLVLSGLLQSISAEAVTKAVQNETPANYPRERASLRSQSFPLSSPIQSNPILPDAQASDSLQPAAAFSSFVGDLYSEYLLGPGDQIRLDILGYEQFEWASSLRVVLSDGNIRLPLVGTVIAAGKTLEDLDIEVTRLLSPRACRSSG